MAKRKRKIDSINVYWEMRKIDDRYVCNLVNPNINTNKPTAVNALHGLTEEDQKSFKNYFNMDKACHNLPLYVNGVPVINKGV